MSECTEPHRSSRPLIVFISQWISSQCSKDKENPEPDQDLLWPPFAFKPEPVLLGSPAHDFTRFLSGRLFKGSWRTCLSSPVSSWWSQTDSMTLRPGLCGNQSIWCWTPGLWSLYDWSWVWTRCSESGTRSDVSWWNRWRRRTQMFKLYIWVINSSICGRNSVSEHASLDPRPRRSVTWTKTLSLRLHLASGCTGTFLLVGTIKNCTGSLWSFIKKDVNTH